jgi:tetratricopeptide (TPR) repeat protein
LLSEQCAVFKRHLQAQFETDKVSAELKSQMLPYREKFNDRIASLDSGVASTIEQLKATELLLEEYKAATLGADGAGGGNVFGNFSAFSDYLVALKKKWDSIVANEHQALEKAVEYYKRAFEESKEIAAGNQQIQASYLIAELSRRIGRYDQAKEYFASTIKHGQEFNYRHREDKAQTALARKIMELATEQNKAMAAQTKSVGQSPVEL